MADTSTHLTPFADALEKLRARTVDSIRGYDEALDHAEPDVAPELQRLRAAHVEDVEAMRTHLSRIAGDPSADGSWMTPVQKAVMQVRAWTTGIDEGVMPAVIRGERSLLELVDDAISKSDPDDAAAAWLGRQRAQWQSRIAELEARHG